MLSLYEIKNKNNLLLKLKLYMLLSRCQPHFKIGSKKSGAQHSGVSLADSGGLGSPREQL